MLKLSLATAITLATLLPAAAQDAAAGSTLYADNCASCHGAEREGMGADFPALKDVGERLKPEEISERITKGGEMMPPFDYLSEEERASIVAFLAE